MKKYLFSCILFACCFILAPQAEAAVWYITNGSETIAEIARHTGADAQLLALANDYEADTVVPENQLLSLPFVTPAIATVARSAEITLHWPLRGTITSLFGERDGNKHEGLDLAADKGTPICAAAAGEVTESGWLTGYGWQVLLTHADGRQTRYAHCSRLAVKEGDSVEAGAIIAYVGSSGRSTGSHLHFEVIEAGICVDPLLCLP